MSQHRHDNNKGGERGRAPLNSHTDLNQKTMNQQNQDAALHEDDATPARGLRRRTLQKAISSVLLVSMGSMITLPAQAAVQAELQKPAVQFNQPTATNLSDALKDLHEVVQRTKRTVDQKESEQKGAGGIFNRLKNAVTRKGPDQARHEGAQAILERELRLNQFENQTRKEFAATEEHLRKAGLPAAILERHAAAVKQFEERSRLLHSKVASLRQAETKDDSGARELALNDMEATLKQWQPKERKVDPNHLPWGSPSNKVRKPHTSKNEYLQNLSMFGVKPVQVAYNGDGAMPAGFVWPTLPNMGSAVLPADTQPTEDVQITPAIQALAAQLQHNPVLIYQYVHDNIKYIPTYGSIQGSDYTLQLKAGNDFDTASLLIALLRASNVPARYVYGTINVPAAQVNNWVGGVNNTDAAQNLLGQGGVPNQALTKGGQVVSVQMEHVWVEAFVNYVPSRGWVNKGGDGDTWVPLDASYKQYAFTAPTINVQEAVPFNAQAALMDAQAGATIDSNGNYVQNLNQASVQASLMNYQQQVQGYLGQQPTGVTVKSLLGYQSTMLYTAKVLPSILPYGLVSVAGDFGTLPEAMRHYFIVQLYQNDQEQQASQQLGQSPTFAVRLSTPSLAGQQLALSFNPSSYDDAAIIQSYLPQPGSNGSIDPSQLPTALPGYAIKVTPQLTVNGQALITTGQLMLGQQVTVNMGYQSPSNTLPLASKIIRAGEYYAIGLDLQGISEAEKEGLQARINNVQSTLKGMDAAKIALLTKNDIVGNMLAANVGGYFESNDAEDNVSIGLGQRSVVAYRFMSFGTFSTNLIPNLSYGVPLSTSFAGAMMDIDRLQRIAADTNNDNTNVVKFISSQGARESLNEGLIPERLFQAPGSTDATVRGISGVRALQMAISQGQKIFIINKQNIESVVPLLNQPSSVVNDIEGSVNAGKVVTISQGPVSEDGWIGAGYVVNDPQTGASAYLLVGGENGALIKGILVSALITAALVAAIIFAIGLAPASLLGIAAVGTEIVGAIWGALKENLDTLPTDVEKACFITGLGIGLTVAGFALGGVGLAVGGAAAVGVGLVGMLLSAFGLPLYFLNSANASACALGTAS